MTVVVSPTTAGTVNILDGRAAVASDIPLVGGTAAATLSGLSDGTHTFTAVFTPADAAAFATSTSPAVTHTVNATVVNTNTAGANTPVAACMANTVSGATLSWGVKSSFRNYISGGIANGSWSLSNLSYSGSGFGWSGGSGSYNANTAKGLVGYNGSVAFTGHDGVLTLTLSNVRIQVTSATTATLIADVSSSDMGGTKVSGKNVAFAAISLGGARASASALSVTNAPATLTATGAAAFAEFYTAGTALDPITFTLPLGASIVCDNTTVPSAARIGGSIQVLDKTDDAEAVTEETDTLSGNDDGTDETEAKDHPEILERTTRAADEVDLGALALPITGGLLLLAGIGTATFLFVRRK